MKRVLTWCSSVIGLVLLLGCEKQHETPAPTSNDAPAVQAPTPAPAVADKAMAATSIDLDKVPVEEQFEKEVETEVTPANFEQQLGALEKEVRAE